MDHKIYYSKGYEQLREDLREELSKSVNSFVRIGYLLKVARDTDILRESGYSNMEEFAYTEFKIDKGTASKFMAINDRFSEGGHSDHLKPEYAGIGWSKLSIMLQLPDSINGEITPGFSKSEIQAIRDEVAAAEKETPMETLLEGETETTAQAERTIDKAVRQLGESEPDIYTQIHRSVNGKEYDLDAIKSAMAPSGEQIYSIRIRGVGRIMLSVKDYEETVSMVNERTGEKETAGWDDLALAWMQIVDADRKPEENWEAVYGQQYPKKQEVAPVQPKKDTKVKKVNKKPESVPKPQESGAKPQDANVHENHVRNESGEQQQLHDISQDVPEVSPAEPEEESAETAAESGGEAPEEQIPGQMSVEDMPEILPDQNVEDDEKAAGQEVVMPRQMYEERRQTYINSYENNIGCARLNRESENWALVKADLKDAMHYLDLLIELENMEVVDEA